MSLIWCDCPDEPAEPRVVELEALDAAPAVAWCETCTAKLSETEALSHLARRHEVRS